MEGGTVGSTTIGNLTPTASIGEKGVQEFFCKRCNEDISEAEAINSHFNHLEDLYPLINNIIENLPKYQSHHSITSRSLLGIEKYIEGAGIEKCIESYVQGTGRAFNDLRRRVMEERERAKERMRESLFVRELGNTQEGMRGEILTHLPMLKGELDGIIRALHSAEDEGGYKQVLHLLQERKKGEMREKVEKFKDYYMREKEFLGGIRKLREAEVVYKRDHPALKSLIPLTKGICRTEKLSTFIQNSSHLYIFNALMYESEKRYLGDYIVPYNYALGDAHGRLFLFGGNYKEMGEGGTGTDFHTHTHTHPHPETPVLINSCSEIKPLTGELINHPSMSRKKRRMGVCFITPYFYIMGGDGEHVQGEGIYLNTVERFSITSHQWDLAPPLNERKACAMGCTFRDRWIYVFGGYNHTDLSTIECLDTKGLQGISISNSGALSVPCHTPHSLTADVKLSLSQIAPNTQPKWTVINLSLQGKENWQSAQNLGCKQLKDRILIFGGFSQGAVSTKAYYYTPASNTMLKTKHQLELGDSFLTTAPKIVGGKLFAVGTHRNDIHLFDVKEEVWCLIKKNNWILG